MKCFLSLIFRLPVCWRSRKSVAETGPPPMVWSWAWVTAVLLTADLQFVGMSDSWSANADGQAHLCATNFEWPLQCWQFEMPNEYNVPSADCYGVELERLVSVVLRALTARQQSANCGRSQRSIVPYDKTPFYSVRRKISYSIRDRGEFLVNAAWLYRFGKSVWLCTR